MPCSLILSNWSLTCRTSAASAYQIRKVDELGGHSLGPYRALVRGPADYGI